MIYISATQEVAYQGLVDYYGNGKLIESAYIKTGVTTERRLIDRPKETSRTITGAAVPLLGINVKVDLIERLGIELPSYEQTREAFERDFRDCLPDCFANGYIPSEAAGECGFAPYIELTNVEKSKNFLRKLDTSINKIRKKWTKDYGHLGIINIHHIWVYKYDDLSRVVLEIFKKYKIDKNKSSINQLRHKERIQGVVEKITSTKLIRLINSGDLRIETNEVSGITSLEGLLTGEKLVKPKKKSLYWRATRDQENGKNYITYVTEVNVDEDGKIGFEDTERDGGKTYDLEEFNKNFFNPNNEPVSINPRTQSRARQVLKALETNPRACLVMCCGTGKSYVAAVVVRSGYFRRILVISPADILLEKTREVIGDWYNVDYITYQSLVNRPIESLSGYDLIIFDEAHRMGAPDWSNGIEYKLFPANPNAKILGMTATPIRYDGINIVERYFNGVSVVNLTFPKAWSNGELPPPTIVETIIDLEGEIEERIGAVKNYPVINESDREKTLSELNTILVDWKNSGGIPEIFRQYLPTSTERIIVFVDSIDYLEEMKYRVAEWFIETGRTPITYKIHSRNSRKLNLLSLSEFEDMVDSGYIKVLLTVDMFNEGYHIPGVESVIFLRRTRSSRIVEQEMGRCMSPSNKNPTVFDFVGNYIKGEFDYISRWRNDLDKEEIKKILRGEKTERDRITIKVVNSFVLKIQEIFEIADKLNNPTEYILRKAEKYYEEEDWEGLKKDKRVYWFVVYHRTNNPYGMTPYPICDKVWPFIRTEKKWLDMGKYMIETKDFSMLVGLEKDSKFYRWMVHDRCLNNEEEQIKTILKTEFNKLNPDRPIKRRRSAEEILNLINQANLTGDYSTLKINNTFDIIGKFIRRYKDTNDSCKKAYEALTDNHNKKLARSIIERGAWEEATNKYNRNFNAWCRHHRAGGRASFIEDCEIICQHIYND